MRKLTITLLIIVGLAVLLFASGLVFVVKQTEYCIKRDLGGGISYVYTEPGVGFMIPFWETTFFYPARARSIDSPPENVVTGDQKKLIVDNYAKWRISDPVLFRDRIAKSDPHDVYMRRATDRISIIIHNALKDILGKVNLSEIVSGHRDSISQNALIIARTESKELGVEILDIRIKKVELPNTNVDKAYARMQAQRFKEADFYRSRGKEDSLSIRAEADKQVTLLLAEADKTSKLVRATADAKAAEIYANAYNQDPEFYDFYRSLEALKKTVDDSTTLVISPNSGLYQYLKAQ